MKVHFLLIMSFFLFLVAAGPAGAADAQEATVAAAPNHLLTAFGAALGAGLACIGAAFGISKIASSSVENIARQPEVSGDIRGAMILTCAFIEGVCLFAVVVTLLAVLRIPAAA